MKKITLLFSLLLCFVTSAQNNITFSVDMAGETFTQVYVSGGFNDWAATDNPLTNVGGTIWEATLSLNDGAYEYKFQMDAWADQENLTQGNVCTITNGGGNTNRFLTVAGTAQTLPTVAFEGCTEYDNGIDSYMLTVNVDMTPYITGGGTIGTAVNINGENYNAQGLGSWCGACIALTDMGGNIWTTTVPLDEHTYEFKMTVDGWTQQELFATGDPANGTVDNGGNRNRFIQMNSDKTIDITWEVPKTLSNEDFYVTADFTAYPNPSNTIWNVKTKDQIISTVQVFDVLGKQVRSLNPNSSEVSIDASTLPSGLYFAKIASETGSNSIKLIKN